MEKLQWEEIYMTEDDGSVTVCKMPTLVGFPDASDKEGGSNENHHKGEYQSIHIINSIEVTIVRPDAPEEKSAMRAFVVVDKAKDPTKKARLVSVDVALGNEAMRSQVLENALMELKSFKRKYEMLSELSKVFKAIDEVVGDEKADNTK